MTAVTWAPATAGTPAWLLPSRTFDADAARLMLPFVERAEALPAEAERILRDGMAFVHEFGTGAPEYDEVPLIRAAVRFLDRNYPVGPCPRCGGMNGSHGIVHVRHGNGGGHNEPCPEATS